MHFCPTSDNGETRIEVYVNITSIIFFLIIFLFSAIFNLFGNNSHEKK